MFNEVHLYEHYKQLFSSLLFAVNIFRPHDILLLSLHYNVIYTVNNIYKSYVKEILISFIIHTIKMFYLFNYNSNGLSPILQLLDFCTYFVVVKFLD